MGVTQAQVDHRPMLARLTPEQLADIPRIPGPASAIVSLLGRGRNEVRGRSGSKDLNQRYTVARETPARIDASVIDAPARTSCTARFRRKNSDAVWIRICNGGPRGAPLQ